jgi:hypothetical protein
MQNSYIISIDDLKAAIIEIFKEVPAVEPLIKIPQKDELTKIILGYLYMTLEEMNYEKKNIAPIIQRLEKNINAEDYSAAILAYNKAENTFIPLIIRGVVIPQEYYGVKIADMKFSTTKVAKRIANALERVTGIHILKDFIGKEESIKNLEKIRNFGKGCQDEFVAELKRIIGIKPTFENNTATASNTIEDIEIPSKFHNYKIGQLEFRNHISRGKLVNNLKKKGIIHIKDFFLLENSDLSRILSYKGRITFLEALKATVQKR